MIKINNDIKEFERCIDVSCSKLAIVSLRKNKIVAINIELEIDISDDIFSSEYVKYIFYFNQLHKRLFKLLSIYNLRTEYVILDNIKNKNLKCYKS